MPGVSIRVYVLLDCLSMLAPLGFGGRQASLTAGGKVDSPINPPVLPSSTKLQLQWSRLLWKIQETRRCHDLNREHSPRKWYPVGGILFFRRPYPAGIFGKREGAGGCRSRAAQPRHCARRPWARSTGPVNLTPHSDQQANRPAGAVHPRLENAGWWSVELVRVSRVPEA